MKIVRLYLLIALLAATFCTATAQETAQEPTEKTETIQQPEQTEKQRDIIKLLRLSGSAELGIQAMDQMMASFEDASAQVPSKFWEDFRKEIKSDDLLTLIVPVYDKYFTHEEVVELIQFYESPIGKKMVATMPLLMHESMEVGKKWGEDIGKKIMKRLKEKGYSKM